MKCRNCGNELDSNNKFCEKCGCPTHYQDNSYPPQYSQQKNNNVALISCLIILIVVTIAFIGVIIYKYRSDTTAESNESVSNNTVYNDITEDIPKTKETAKPESKNQQSNDSEMSDGYVPPKKVEQKARINQDKYDEFSSRAQDIEEYDKIYLQQNAMSQNEMNIESYNVYMKWDALLNEIYQYLKRTMPANEFKSLESDEIQWIKNKEAAIEAADDECEGGSMAPFLRNCAGIEHTRNRCYYLMSLIK